jgi:hypothetical protein
VATLIKSGASTHPPGNLVAPHAQAPRRLVEAHDDVIVLT